MTVTNKQEINVATTWHFVNDSKLGSVLNTWESTSSWNVISVTVHDL